MSIGYLVQITMPTWDSKTWYIINITRKLGITSSIRGCTKLAKILYVKVQVCLFLNGSALCSKHRA